METMKIQTKTTNNIQDHEVETVEQLNGDLIQFEPPEHQFSTSWDRSFSFSPKLKPRKISPLTPLIQPKLKIGHSNDTLNKEVNMKEGDVVQKMDKTTTFKPVQRKRNNNLPEDLQTKMEDSFGQDFSGVKIQKDSQEAVNLNALAFTEGDSIHFAPGKFDPSSESGQELIGHELTHVVQQRSGVVKPSIQNKGKSINKDRKLEREADIFGQIAAKGEKINHSYSISSPNESIQTKCDDCNEEEKATNDATLLEIISKGQIKEKENSVTQMKSGVIQMHTVADCNHWKDICDEGCRTLPNRTKKDKYYRMLCWSRCMAEYATCLASAQETLTFAAIVAAIVLAAADGPFPIGDAAAAALLISVGIFPE